MTTTPVIAASLTIPPLENGDKLTRWEFERRYQGMPHLKKAELIEGIVYMASPLRFESHAEPHANIIGWLALYKAATPGVRLGDNATVRLDIDDVQFLKNALLEAVKTYDAIPDKSINMAKSILLTFP